MKNTSQKPNFKESFFFWLKLGFISFGGPAGQIAIMHDFLVEKKKWISDCKFLHALNYCMVLPGPEAQQMATYMGWMFHGTIGALTAGILFVLPSMFILLGLSTIYVLYGNIPWIYAIFDGLKPAIIAIVILALIKIGKKALISKFHYSVATIAFILIFFFNTPFPLIILGSLLVALISKKLMPNLFKSVSKSNQKITLNENDYLINSNTITRNTGFSFKNLIIQIFTGLFLWSLPICILYFFTSDFTFWKNLILFFTKAAFVTFGGAYAVLPYVAQVSVEQFSWLTNSQMIDGLALGETTPGPLVMVLVFVGFMAGFNHFNGSVLMGALGLVITTFYTFLSCFLFIFIGAPLIEKSNNNNIIKELLSLVSAAVVGVILNLTLYLGKSIVFVDSMSFNSINYESVIWLIISFIALYRFKINMIVWIFISALFSLISYAIVHLI